MDVSLKYSLDGLTWREAILNGELADVWANDEVGDVGNIVYKDGKFIFSVIFQHSGFWTVCSDDGINWRSLFESDDQQL